MKGLTVLLSTLVIALATKFNPAYAQTSSSCSVPTGLTATGITASSATLKWLAVSSAKRYVVEYEVYGASSWSYDTVSVDSLVLTGLPDTTYVAFEVEALCSDTASSGFSSYYIFETTLSTTIATCSVPTGLSATVSSSSATLKWSAVSGAKRYVVGYEKYGTTTWINDTVSVDSLVITGLADSTYYLFDVKSLCSDTSSSSFSSTSYFKTLSGSTTATCSTPTGLSATTGSTSATLKWSAVSGAKRYVVGYEKYGTSTWTNDTVSVDSLVITGLADSTYYLFDVKSLCSDTSSSSFSSTSYFKTLPGSTTATCSTPTGLSATVGSTSATLKWYAVSGAKRYVVGYEKYGSTVFTYDTVSVDSLVLTGLVDGSYYIFEVKSICSDTTSSSFSSTYYFKTTSGSTTTTCATPTGLSATAGSTSATLKWYAVSGAKRYVVGYEKYGSTVFIYDTVSVDSLVLTGLVDSSYYIFEVKSICSDTTSSSFSSTYYFKTTSGTTSSCSVPTGLTASSITASSGTVKWSPVSGAIGYVVEYEKYGASAWSYDTVSVDSLTLTGLADTTYYLFEVKTLCSATSSSSYSSYYYFKTSGTTSSCSAPTGLTATGITASSATLKWSAVSGASGYIVSYASSGGTKVTDTVTTDSLSISGLSAGTYYVFYVVTICSGGSTSGYSESHFTTVSSTTYCYAPTGLGASATSSSATLKWSAVSGAAGYVVAYHKYGASTWNYDTVSVDSLVLTGLVDTSYYIFEVKTLCSATSSSTYSSYYYFKTTSGTTTATCTAPSGLSATAGSSSATLKWSAVSGAKRYVVGYEKYGSTAFTYDTVTVDSLVLTGLVDSSYYIFEVKSLCSDTTSSSFSSTYYFKTTSGTKSYCSVPTGLTATGITASSGTVKWSPVSGAIGYVVEYEKYGASAWSYDTVSVDSLTLTGLADTTYYIFEVKTLCSATSSSSYSSYYYFKTTGTKSSCSSPTGLTATSITASSATLKWSAVYGASSYIVTYASSGSAKVTDTVTTDSLAISGLTPGAYYVFYVVTICSGGSTSGYSESHFTTVSSTATCSVPTGLSASTTSSSATLKWSAVSGAAGYVVAYHEYGAPTWSYDTVSVDSLVLTGLVDSTYYIFEVKTLCSATSSSSYSSYYYFKTASGTTSGCSAPTGLTATGITASSATLKWYAVSGASGYIVTYASSSTTKVTDTVSADSLAISGLSASTYYYFYVETICSGGSTSSYVETHFITDSSYTATCSAPTGLSATTTSSSATLKWSAVSGAAGYVVEYHKSSVSAWSYDTVSVDSLVLTGLVDSTYYIFEVKTLCSATSSSSYSSYYYFKTTSGSSTGGCSAPEHLYATSITTSSATLTWSPVSGASGYIVVYASSGSKVIDTVTTDSLAISGLTAGTYYAFYVETICSGGSTSGYSSSSFTTHYTYTYCSAPTGLTETGVTSSSATLKWSAVSGAKGYIVVFGKYGGTATFDTVTADSIVLTGLSAGTSYGFYVETMCSSTSVSGESTGATFTTTGGCPAPYDITSTGTSTSTATIKWHASSGAVGFVVAYRAYGTLTWSYDTTSTADSVVISGLSAGTYYQYEVLSLCSDTSSSSFSSIGYFETTKATAVTCPVVTDLTVTNITTGSAVIKWNAASGAVSYVVAYSKYGSGSWTIDTVTADSILITGLSSGAYYEYLVKTLCDSGYAYTSTSYFKTTVGFTCPTPYDLTVTNISDSSATITWKVDSGAVGFLIEYRKYGSSTWSYGVATGDSFVVSGLSASTVYQYTVISGCADTTYSSSTAATTFETGAKSSGCSEVTGLTATSTYSSATVKWAAASGATSYVVFYSKYGSGTWTLDTTTADSLVLTGLTSGSYYEYLVKTLCSGGYSYSSTYYLKTLAEPTCPTPTEVTATGVTTSSATIKWYDTSSGATFVVAYRAYGSVTWTDSTTTNDSLVITGLSAGTYYQYDVEAICSDSTYSSYSSLKYLKTSSDTGGTHRMANPESVSGVPGDEESIAVYPNPSNDQFTVAYQLTASQPVTVIISNYMGQTISMPVSNEVQNEGKHQYSFTPKSAGMYFVRIEMGNNVIVKKVIRL